MKRVVVTGMGIISPLGNNINDAWSKILSSQSAISQIDRFDFTKFPSQIAGLVKDFDPEKYMSKKDANKIDLFIQYAMAAASQAIEESDISNIANKERIGVSVGSGIGGLRNIENTKTSFINGKKISPFFIPSTLINLAPGNISIKYGFKGPNYSVVTACSTSADSIGFAYNNIKYGDADIMVAGGSEAAITELSVGGFSACRALSTSFNDRPSIASKPWCKKRDGFVISEGAGILILEEYEHAKKRNANIYGEVLSYAITSDGYHIVAPEPEGKGAIRTMKIALEKANLTSDNIDYINAHGTSTPTGDLIELRAVEKIFNHKKTLMSSTKSFTGHSLGATGAIEIILTLLAMKNNIAPPTLNIEEAEETQFDLIKDNPRDYNIKYAMSNNFGFGGTNASMIFKKI